MGSMMRFGPVGAFVTPNVNDLGHPLVVKIHRQCNGAEDAEHYLDLLEDAPNIPSKRDMLCMIAKDPLSQIRFFIFCYQMFMMHVLGVGDCGRHAAAQWGQRWNGARRWPSCELVGRCELQCGMCPFFL